MRIPWRRLLLEEIQSEEILRRYSVDAGAEMPLSSTLSLLPTSFLKSWRVRDQIQVLSCEARGASLAGAVKQLRMVFHRLIGRPGRDQAAFSGHLWFAYQRVLLLQRACHAARESRGTNGERLTFIRSKTHCSFEDAAWALCREDAPLADSRLDAAVEKVRYEGFRIPPASTGARTLAKLRRIVRASAVPARRSRSTSGSHNPVSLPRRVTLPADAI